MTDREKKLIPSIDEPASAKESQDAELLDSMIDALRAGKSPKDFCIGSAGRAAVRLHTRTSAAQLDPTFQQSLEKQLVRRFSEKASPQHRWKIWTLIGVPAATLAVVVLGVVATLKPEIFQQQATPTNNTVAQVVGLATTSNTNIATAGNTNMEITDTTPQPEAPQTVQELFPDVKAELVSVEPELSNLTDIKNELENTMVELEELIQDIEYLENMSTESDDVDQLLQDLESSQI